MGYKLMGVDFGTGGCKTTIINDNGEVLGEAYKEYPSIYPHPGWCEQDPGDWIEAFNQTVKECLQTSAINKYELAGLALTASTHNAVLVDGNGDIIRPCIMWNDQRSGEQSERLKQNYGDIIFHIGMQMPTPTWTMPQLLWVKENEPENYKRIAKIYFTKDFVRNYVTGDWFTDHVDAQGSLLYDALKMQWSSELCRIIDLPLETLPPVVKSKQIVGKVKKEVSLRTGLPDGLPVVAGCSDTAAEDFGAGAILHGQMIVKMATAGNVNMMVKEARPNPKSFTYPHAVEGMWYTVLGTNSSASSYRWLRDSIFPVEKDDCAQKGQNIYEYMDKMAANVVPGSRGLIFHPYLLGERCPYFDHRLRANFFGISMVHKKEHFARSVLEGVAFSLYDCFQIIKQMNEDISEVRLIGGGAKSKLWSQILCDVFGIPVLRPRNDDSSFGGALLAGVGIGLFNGEVDAVNKCVKIEQKLIPNPDNHKKYEELFKIYQEIVHNLTQTYSKLYSLTN